MSRKIYGVTVGTTTSPKLIEKKLKPVKTVNGSEPDENGNVQVGGSAEAVQANLDAHTGNKKNPHGVTAEQVGALPMGGGAMQGDIVMGGHRVTGLGNPQDDGDAVPLGYANGHFAPAGYGLGGYSQGLGSWANLDNIRANGWYYWQSDLPINAPAEWCDMFVSAQEDHIFQIIMPFGKRGCIITRTMIGNDAIVEWMNPPMELGVEYRTMERWNGKVVYAKALNCGALAGYKNVGAGMADGSTIIRGVAILDGRGPLPFDFGVDNEFNCKATFDVSIYLYSNGGYNGKTVYAHLWYIKD